MLQTYGAWIVLTDCRGCVCTRRFCSWLEVAEAVLCELGVEELEHLRDHSTRQALNHKHGDLPDEELDVISEDCHYCHPELLTAEEKSFEAQYSRNGERRL